MELREIYRRCGLRDPDEFKKEIITDALFSDHHVVKNIIGYGRRQGKTTNFMMSGIQNLFEGKNTIIWVTNFSIARDCHHAFLRYSSNFPELNIEVCNNGQFSTNINGKKTILKFVTLHNNIPQARIEFNWDIELDDSY